MGEGDAYRLFQRFDARNTGTIQYADFVRFVDGPSAGDGGGAGDDDAAAYGPPSPMRLRDRRRDVGNKRGGSGSGVSLTAARHKIMNTLCRYSGSYGRLRGAFKRKDPGDRGVMHATMFESVLKQSGVPLMRAEVRGAARVAHACGRLCRGGTRVAGRAHRRCVACVCAHRRCVACTARHGTIAFRSLASQSTSARARCVKQGCEAGV